MYQTSKGYIVPREMYHIYIPAKSFDVWPWGDIYIYIYIYNIPKDHVHNEVTTVPLKIISN